MHLLLVAVTEDSASSNRDGYEAIRIIEKEKQMVMRLI